MRLDSGLFGVEPFYELDIVAAECEAGDVGGVVLDQILGNNIKVGHTLRTFYDGPRNVKVAFRSYNYQSPLGVLRKFSTSLKVPLSRAENRAARRG